MVKSFIYVFCVIGLIYSCSPNQKLLKRHDYITVIRNSLDSLNCNEKDAKANKKLIQAYSQAIEYYQKQLDLTITSNDPSRWTKTLDIMQKTNELSNEILYNSSALQLIRHPKIYRNEMADVASKAAQELYLMGINCLNQGTREKAREACAYFIRTNQLRPKYKDVEQKIREATSEATLKIIIEEVPVSYQDNVLSYSTQTFCHCLFYLLKEKFTSDEYIAFYSPEEAQKQSVTDPDYSIQIEIEDFEIESWNIKLGYSKPHFSEYYEDQGYRHYTDKLNPAREPGDLIDTGVSSTPNQIKSQLLMSANSIIKINSLHEYKVVYKKKMPWRCTEDLDHPVSSEIGQSYLPDDPDYQVFFDHFSLPMVDKVGLLITNFFKQFN